MKISEIFDVFSRRNKQAQPFIYRVPQTLRSKILMFCREVFSNSRGDCGSGDYTEEFWGEIHQTLSYRHGRLQLVENGTPRSRAEDAIEFLFGCKDEEFLDFVEYIFRVECLFHISTEKKQIVNELNQLFASESVGYELTEYIEEEVVEPVFGRERKVIKVAAYPKVIRKDDQVTHSIIIMPALQLLVDPRYKTANQEYIEALEDYRKGDYGDCLTKCCSAFESVMKIICDQKGWPYKQTDTASTLVSTMIKNTSLDSYFEQPLIIIATLRNRLSKSHGSGTRPKNVPQHLAQFVLNSTGSAIILLVNETK